MTNPEIAGCVAAIRVAEWKVATDGESDSGYVLEPVVALDMCEEELSRGRLASSRAFERQEIKAKAACEAALRILKALMEEKP